jgi:serine protease Do
MNDDPNYNKENDPGPEDRASGESWEPQSGAPEEAPRGDSSEGQSASGAEGPAPSQNGDAQQQPYQQPNNPYGQYGNPYGGYGGGYGYGQQGGSYGGNPPPYGRQPYGGAPGQNNSPYGGQNGGNDYRWQQYQQPYGNYGPQGPTPPHRMNTGLKVFLWILGVVTVGLIAACGIFAVRTAVPGGASSSGTSSSLPGTSSAVPGGAGSGSSSSGSASSAIGGVQGDGTNPASSGITIEQKPSGLQMGAPEVYKKVIQSVVGVKTTVEGGGTNGESGTSEGTGIIATSDGTILTNAHVVNYSRTNKVQVVLHDNKTYSAKVVGYDKTADLAVLKINATGLSPAQFGSVDDMEVGDQVIAIGNPGGLSFAGSLTVGYISALDRSIEEHSDNGMTYIQTDAAINPGNSGGPLVNMFGQVVGINSNKIIATGYEGMGFAIPVSQAKSTIDDLITKGYVSGRTRLGITASTVTDMYTQFYGFPQGVLIQAIGNDSDMKASGVVKGDIITKADGANITSMDDLYAVLEKHKPGDVVKMTIVSTSLSETGGGKKAGTSREISVKLLEDKGQTQTVG